MYVLSYLHHLAIKDWKRESKRRSELIALNNHGEFQYTFYTRQKKKVVQLKNSNISQKTFHYIVTYT